MKNRNNPIKLLGLVFFAMLFLLVTESCGDGSKHGNYSRKDDNNPCGIIPELKKMLKAYKDVFSICDGLIVVGSNTIMVDETGSRFYPMGCIDINGKVVLPCKYRNVRVRDGLVFVSDNKKDGVKCGLYDLQGKELVPIGKFDDFRYGGFFGDYAVVIKDGLCGVIDKMGNVVIPVQYDDINHFYYPNYNLFDNLPDVFIGYKNGKMEYFNLTKDSSTMGNRPATPYDFVLIGEYGSQSFMDYQGHIIAGPYQNVRASDRMPRFPEGLAAVVKNNKVGFIDDKGVTRIPFGFEYSEFHFNISSLGAYIFSEDLCAIMNSNKKWGYIDKQGKVVIPFNYDAAYCFHQGSAIVGKRIGGKDWWGLIDKNDVALLPFEFEHGVYTGNVLAMCKNGKWGIFSPQGSCIVSCQFEQQIVFYKGYATVMLNGKEGLIDEQGRLLIPCEYESVLYDEDADMVYVKQNGKTGYVDLRNKEVVSIKFDWVDWIGDGFFGVSKDGRYGLYDLCGNCTLD